MRNGGKANWTAAVEQMTDGIGWGFHDFVAAVVGRLEEDLAEAEAPNRV
jgi:hypothetical protein